MIEILLAALLAGVPSSVPDTVFQARPGDQLRLKDFTGSVEVGVGDRDEIWAGAESDGALSFRATRRGRVLELEVLDRKNRNRAEELLLQVPAWIDLDFSGPRLDVSVDGLSGQVRIRTLRGDLELENLSGKVEASTVQGSINAWGMDGEADLKTGHDEIFVSRSRGTLQVETISGDITLSGATAPNIGVKTTKGDVEFQGRFLPGGEYEFRSHGGEMEFFLEPPVDANMTVIVYEGEFSSDFPIRTRGFHSGKDLRFTIGDGGPTVLVEAFNGEVTLSRGRDGE